MSDRDGTTSRIAIKLGSSSLNGGAKKSPRPTPPSSLGKRHRARALDGDHSGSDDDEEGGGGRREAITTYGPDGASTEDRRQRRRTRSRSPDRRRRGHRYEDRRGDESLKETEPADKDKDVQWGLSINKKAKREDDDATRRAGRGAPVEEEKVRKSPKTADEEAMDALLGDEKDRKRVAVSEGNADRDPVPEDYEKVPIDDFGAHLLKNFGWDGKMIGKVKDVKKHANLTGLGAKGKGAEDLGAWSQKPVKDGGGHDKPRRPRLDEYRREEEKRKQRREERHRESDRHRDSRESSHRRDRDSDRDRDRDRDRDSDRRHRDKERDRR